jgi:hypothetical protein
MIEQAEAGREKARPPTQHPSQTSHQPYQPGGRTIISS